MKITFKRALPAVLILLFLVYGVDYLQLRYRIWRNKQPYGTVTVQLLYAISKKAPEGTDRTEYASGNAQDETCVNSLFPHFGFSPCWYLSRHTERQVNI